MAACCVGPQYTQLAANEVGATNIGMKERFRKWRDRHKDNEISRAFKTESKKGAKVSEDVYT